MRGLLSLVNLVLLAAMLSACVSVSKDPRIETERIDVEATRTLDGVFSTTASYSSAGEGGILGPPSLSTSLPDVLGFGTYSANRVQIVLEEGQSLTTRWFKRDSDEEVWNSKTIFLVGRDFRIGADGTIQFLEKSEAQQIKGVTEQVTTRRLLFISTAGDLVVTQTKTDTAAGIMGETILFFLPIAMYANWQQVAIFPRVREGSSPEPPAAAASATSP